MGENVLLRSWAFGSLVIIKANNIITDEEARQWPLAEAFPPSVMLGEVGLLNVGHVAGTMSH
jgi:hypothetical protein